MSDKEKLEKVVKLADAMYYAAQNMTTDASRLRKAMEEYHQFIIHDYCKKEPASEDLEKCVVEQMETDGDVDDFVRRGIDDIASKYAQLGAQWQKEQMMKNAINAHVNMEWNHLSLGGFAWSQTGLGFGDKCKLIIIKE